MSNFAPEPKDGTLDAEQPESKVTLIEFYCPHCGKDEGVYYEFGMCNSCGEALTA